MKNKILVFFSILIFVFLLAFNAKVHAQEKSEALNINPQFSFFFVKDKNLGKSIVPINPGGEIIYEFDLNNKLSLSSGINYSYSEWTYSIGIKSHFKRLAHEIYLPFFTKLEFNQKIYAEFGIYPGWLIKGKELYKNNIDIKHWTDNTKNTSYNSNTKFSADLYIGTGFNQIINEKRSIKFIPFLKYKIKDNWMGETRKKTNLGLKIIFPINI